MHHTDEKTIIKLKTRQSIYYFFQKFQLHIDNDLNFIMYTNKKKKTNDNSNFSFNL